MAKPNKNKPQPQVAKPILAKKPIQTAATPQVQVANLGLPEWLTNPQWHVWGIGLLALLLYINTLGHGYTLDDAIVIYDNMFTTKGLAGIGGLLSEDTFYGFFKESGKGALVAGGRYRPLTPIMFAIEWQIFGKAGSVFWNHLINIVFYALCCVAVYKVLFKLLSARWAHAAAPIALGAALLFTTHPLHTEAVANIKGRDEIVTLLLSLVAVGFAWRAHYDKKGLIWTFLCGVAFLGALLAKENAIAFVALGPLSLRVFAKKSWEDVFKSAFPFIAATLIFLLMRYDAIGWQFGGKQMELMNNPFLKLVGNQWVDFSTGEKLGTVFVTLGKYILLLLFPHPLSHDYYPMQIDTVTLANPLALISFLVYGGLIYLAFRVFSSSSVISYSIAFYLASLFVVSNLIFPIGTNMGERFVFMPSLGFCLGVSTLAFMGWKEKEFRSSSYILGGLIAVAVLFSLKTVMRNPVWKNDLTLFSSDVAVSPKSAKLQNACAGAKFITAVTQKDTATSRVLLNEALDHAYAAVRLHPTYRNAYTIKGGVLLAQSKLDSAILTYEVAQKLDPNFAESRNGLVKAYRERGRQAGEREQNLPLAIGMLQKAFAIDPKDAETARLLGVANIVGKNVVEAGKYFELALQLAPENPNILYECGSFFIQTNRVAEGQALQEKAIKINPNFLQERGK